MLWMAQIMPYLHGQQLLGFVDGRPNVAPNKIITETMTDGATQVLNPCYQLWVQQEQLVLSTIMSSLSPKVLSQVLLLSTAAEVWNAFERMFSSQSKAKYANPHATHQYSEEGSHSGRIFRQDESFGGYNGSS